MWGERGEEEGPVKRDEKSEKGGRRKDGRGEMGRQK